MLSWSCHLGAFLCAPFLPVARKRRRGTQTRRENPTPAKEDEEQSWGILPCHHPLSWEAPGRFFHLFKATQLWGWLCVLCTAEGPNVVPSHGSGLFHPPRATRTGQQLCLPGEPLPQRCLQLLWTRTSPSSLSFIKALISSQ